METPAPSDGGDPPAEPQRSIRIVVSDDLVRSRPTVLFRLVLAIPHLLLLTFWNLAAFPAAIVLWLAVLLSGRPPQALHSFLSSYVRYVTHVLAYLSLAASPFPGVGEPGYPVDVAFSRSERQSRLGAGVRLALVLLAFGALLAAGLAGVEGLETIGSVVFTFLLLGWFAAIAVLEWFAPVAILGWFASLARGRMPEGLRDLTTYALGYGAQAAGYALLQAGRYPDSRPVHVEPPPRLPPHPVRLELRDDLGRSRPIVVFRLLLAFPHFVWVTLWSVPALVAVVVGWLAAIATGRLPLPLHRFLAAYVRYWCDLTSFVTLVGRPFPGFTGARGSYPVGIEIDHPVRQGRWSVLFRGVLAIPALMVAGVLSGILFVAAVLGWFAAVAVGRMPHGLRDIGATSIRYHAQTYGYLALLTPRYPYACPAVAAPPAPPAAALEPEPAVA